MTNATHSAESLANALRSHIDSGDGATDQGLKTYIEKTLIRDGLGVRDVSDAEVQQIVDHPELSAYTFADIVSRRAQIGWSTHGHSGMSGVVHRRGSKFHADRILLAVDVNIYSTTNVLSIAGNHENTEVGEFIRDYLSLDLQPITKELIEKGIKLDAAALEGGSDSNWMGKRLKSVEGLAVLDHYHGDFKH